MNWGNRLLLVFAGFATLIGTLVYRCMHQNFELVSKDYYTEELRYQQKIDGMNNAAATGSIQLEQTAKQVKIILPAALTDNGVTGEVYFYCPSNSALDFKLSLQKGMLNIEVDKSTLKASAYKVKLSLQAGSKPYYYEQSLIVK